MLAFFIFLAYNGLNGNSKNVLPKREPNRWLRVWQVRNIPKCALRGFFLMREWKAAGSLVIGSASDKFGVEPRDFYASVGNNRGFSFLLEVFIYV